MKIGILIKQVPDTETKIKVKSDSSEIETENIKWIVNPYDEYAIEQALKLKESVGEAETIVISAGPERVTEALRTALAMGVDDAIRIIDNDAFASGDSFLTAKALAKVSEQESFDIIFVGKQAVDFDNSQVPQILASLLNLPCVTNVSKFEFKEGKVTVWREVEGGAKQKWEPPTPCIIGATKGLNEPRYTTLPGIMKSKKKEIKKVTLADLGIDPAQTTKTEIKKYSLPPERQAGKKIKVEEGKEAGAAKELAEFLRKDAKVI